MFKFLCGLIPLFLFGNSIWAADILEVDRIAAIVGKDVVTSKELALELEDTVAALRRQGQKIEASQTLRKQVLERMITVKSLTALADSTGIRATDDDVRRGFEGVARESGMDVEAYLRQLELAGGSIERLRKKLIDETKILKLRQRELQSQIVVSDLEINSFLKKNEQSGGVDDESLLAHILIRVPEEASEAEVADAHRRAMSAVNRIDNGIDFRQVAAETSDATDALEGGVLGWRNASNIPGLFVDAVAGMRIGGRSEILESPNGLHILYLLDKRGVNAQIVVQETLVRHILIRVDQLSSDDAALRKTIEIRNRILNNGEAFEELARSLSDDGSATKDGMLGWLLPGDTVEPFERAMSSLDIGKLSEPVRTQYGYHLIEVVDRRDSDISAERRRAVAREAISQRKLEFRFQEWVREVRDTTYIEYLD